VLELVLNPFHFAGTLNTAFVPNTLPTGTKFHKWDPAAGAYHPIATYTLGSGWSPNYPLFAGEGGFIEAPASTGFELRRWGEVPQGEVKVPVAGTYTIIGSRVPQARDLPSLGFPVVEGDSVYIYNPAFFAYDSYSFLDGAWEPSVPVPPVGAAFWLHPGTTTPRTWTRNFSVW
jgi:hypothetical protein